VLRRVCRRGENIVAAVVPEVMVRLEKYLVVIYCSPWSNLKEPLIMPGRVEDCTVRGCLMRYEISYHGKKSRGARVIHPGHADSLSTAPGAMANCILLHGK
jgi:hypothetical protein